MTAVFVWRFRVGFRLIPGSLGDVSKQQVTKRRTTNNEILNVDALPWRYFLSSERTLIMLLRVACNRSVTLSTGFRLLSKRTFFASSTDHTSLLQESQVHRLGNHLYVMAAAGMDAATVQKVPQLHLARLLVDNEVIHGAKVVNRSLGSPAQVCGKLVDAALKDIGAGNAQAKSTLHGLSEWVMTGIKEKEGVDAYKDLSATDLQVLEAIASGALLQDPVAYAAGKEGWERLAREFIEKGQGEEAALYVSKGGKLTAVEHLVDASDFANTSGGAMAVFSF